MPSFTWGARFFMAGLGLSFFFAFLSIAFEAEMLIGPKGILPLDDFMNRLSRNRGGSTFTPGFDAFWAHVKTWPTLTWFSSDLSFVYGLTITGLLLSILLALGFMPGLMCLSLWCLYLSLTIAGQRFFYFQWDNFILEIALLSACILPFFKWRTTHQHLARLPIFFFGFLLFKVILSSAMAKWNSGDNSWHNLTALTFHYETQPLPTPFAFIFHQGPLVFHQLGCFITFVIQMGAPFLLFAPRRLRHLGAVLILVHQVLIALTGNYNFFNLLTISLCFTQLDDDFYRWVFRRTSPSNPQSPVQHNPLKWIGWSLAIAITLMSFGRMCQVVAPNMAPKTLVGWADDLRRYRSINTYGLFARMTKIRPEITLQGSDDGQTWKDYVFHHKPGPVDRMPSFVAPLQPRVDWQMWFAALGNHQRNPWLTRMMRRILAHEPAMFEMFEHNPFEEAPPKYLRAMIQNYTFTSWSKYQQTGNIWQKETPRVYHPVIER